MQMRKKFEYDEQSSNPMKKVRKEISCSNATLAKKVRKNKN